MTGCRTLQTEHYAVAIGSIGQPLEQLLAKSGHGRIVVIADENTHRLCLPVLHHLCPALKKAPCIVVKAGEKHKNLQSCSHIWQQMLAHGIGRRDLAINLGGGVVGDMGGFAASCYKRGIGFIQLPTTVLAQVDASVGGKLGIDFEGVKNCVGVFNNPVWVGIDPVFLQTLPARQLLNGFAEVVKHALIADAGHFEALQSVHPLSQPDWERIIVKSVGIKHQIVSRDPFEAGLRKILNFGHTIGHAVESHSLLHDETPLLHGEAVAIGMMAELHLSKAAGLPDAEYELALGYLTRLYAKYPKRLTYRDLERYLANDKKNEGEQISFSLLAGLGRAKYDCFATRAEIDEALRLVTA